VLVLLRSTFIVSVSVHAPAGVVTVTATVRGCGPALFGWRWLASGFQ
jgi:hypothetical protein